jgi:hypothetical protein
MIHTAHQRLMRMEASIREQAPAGQEEETHLEEEEALVASAGSVAHKVQEAFRADSKT